jgi:hypothetical protein
MALAQLKTVKKSRKDLGKCSNCGDPLPAGCSYRYYRPAFRSPIKIRVCMKPECTPTQSDRESSRMKGAYAAQEAALATIDGATEVSEIQDALDQAAADAQEVLDEYETAIEAAPMIEDQIQPQRDALEAWVEEIEGVDLDPYDPEDVKEEAHSDASDAEDVRNEGHDCDECQRVRTQWFEDRQEQARDAINALEY